MNIAPLISRTPPPISDVVDQEDDEEDITVYPTLQFCHQNDSSPEGVDKVIIDDTLSFGYEVQDDLSETDNVKSVEIINTPDFYYESNGTNQITSDNHVDSIISSETSVNCSGDCRQSSAPIELLDCKNILESAKHDDKPIGLNISYPLSNGCLNNSQKDNIEDLNLDQIKYNSINEFTEVLETSFVPPLKGDNGVFGFLTENNGDFGSVTQDNSDSGFETTNNGDFCPLTKDNGDFGPLTKDNGDFCPLTKDNGDFGPLTKDNGDFCPLTKDNGDFGPLINDNKDFGPSTKDNVNFGVLTCDNDAFGPSNDNNVEFGEFEESNYQSSLTVVNDVEINSTDDSNEVVYRESLEIHENNVSKDESHDQVCSNVCRISCVDECKCFNETACTRPLKTEHSVEFDDEIVFQSVADLHQHLSSPHPVNFHLVTKENSCKLKEQNPDSSVDPSNIVSPSFEVSFPKVIETVGLNEAVDDFEDDEFSEFVECTYVASSVSDSKVIQSTDPYKVFSEEFIEANISPVLLLCLKEEINKNSVWNKLSSLENTPALDFKWNESFSSSRLLSSLRIDSRNILTGHWSKSSKKLQSSEYHSSNESCSSNSNTNFNKTCVPHPQFEWNGSGLINPLDDASCRHKKSSQHVANISNEAEQFIASFPDLSYLKQTFIVFPKNIN